MLGPLRAASAELNVPLDDAALARFERYLDEVLHWRRRLNIIPTGDAVQIVNLYSIDALLALWAADFPQGCRAVDVGSGAGFPGIPMKIARPDLRITLLEASRRRVGFLEHVCAVLTLDDVEIEWVRAEDFGRRSDRRETYDRSVERAAARIAAALELCLPLVRVGGAAVFLKGPRAHGEVARTHPLITGLGGQVISNEISALPTTDNERAVIIVGKVAPTPPLYPRTAGRLGRPP
ncbi:MAG TPA: 16S rRNA (guanine(527)-N(7))-methyltransferase RsmG [bacterium]|nr:16S rRNA (guanine(527)-N(7))-methyltransferase RsmG [bacterium]